MTRLMSSPSSKATALFLCIAVLVPLTLPTVGLAGPAQGNPPVQIALGSCADETSGGLFGDTLESALALAMAGAEGYSLVPRDADTADCVVDARLIKTSTSPSAGRATAQVALVLRDRSDGHVVKEITVEGRSRTRPKDAAVDEGVLIGEAIAQAAETGALQVGQAADATFAVTSIREQEGYCRVSGGEDDAITEGSEFTIFRAGKAIARAQVTNVGRLDALCKIVELEDGVALRQGDTAKLTFRAAPKPKKHKSSMDTALAVLLAAGLVYLIARNSGGHDNGGGAARITLTASPQTAAANATDTVTITATVSTGDSNPVPDATTVEFRVTNNLGVIQPSATTTNGTASVTMTAPSTPGTATVQATVGNVSQTISITFTATGQTSENVTLAAGNPSILADGLSTTSITAAVRDDSGQPIQQGTVDFTTTAGTFPGGGASVSVDLVNGIAVTTLKSSTTEETATVTATLNGTTESASATIQFTNILITGIAAEPTSIQVGGAQTSTVTADVITSVGDPMSDGTVVNFSLDAASVASGAQITQSAVTQNGKAVAIVRSGTLAGPVQITVRVGAVSGSFTPLTFTAAPPDHIIMAVETGKWNTRANTIDPVGITAVVADQFNNPVADGTSVYFTTDVGVITGSAETTKGVATAQIRSDGTLAIANVSSSTVGTGGAIITGGISKLFSGPPASVTFLQPPNGSNLTASTPDNKTTTKVIVQVLDPIGNLVVAGTAVEFTCSAGQIGSATTEDGTNYSTAAATYTAPETIGPVTITAVAGLAPAVTLSLNIN